ISDNGRHRPRPSRSLGAAEALAARHQRVGFLVRRRAGTEGLPAVMRASRSPGMGGPDTRVSISPTFVGTGPPAEAPPAPERTVSIAIGTGRSPTASAPTPAEPGGG